MSAIPDSTFADPQELIAELQRQLAECRVERDEALEQQTATAEVLQVINSSPGNLVPVFEAMVDRAMRLCDAAFGGLWIYDGRAMHRVASRRFPRDAVEAFHKFVPPAGAMSHEIVQGAAIVHVSDVANSDAYQTGVPSVVTMVDTTSIRTGLWIALRKDHVLLGMFVLYRTEVRPYSEKQIALLQNFAAQAVIAMENARLLTETREALEQQTATAEVLQVINSSSGDLTPVFDAMLEKVTHLCDAAFGVMITWDGECFHSVSFRGVPPELMDLMREPRRPVSRSFADRLLKGESVICTADLLAADESELGPGARAHVRFGARSHAIVALRTHEKLLGAITIYRREVRPFSEQQIALLQNFAAQAVIAIENARLLNEIRRRQAELQVTFDNMADGVAMFDHELRITAWNRNFQHMLDLPDAVLSERPTYTEYLRTLAERGEFGTEDVEAELSRRLDAVDRELRFERTRPDGRVLEVRRNMVPDGGFVLIYSDITERKRSEAEIRAARDAAEAAYRDLKSAQASLVQSEKMASLGQLTAGIAHEIKNPLNFVNNFAGLSIELLDELKETAAPGLATLGDDTRAEIDETVEMLMSNLDKIAEHGKRADNIVKSMLEHSRGVSGERREIDLNALVDEALNLAYHGARAQDASFNITLERDFQPGLAPIEVAPQEMMRVLLNLFSNGFYAATKRAHNSGDGAFRPTLGVVTREKSDVVAITVRDNGTGISPGNGDKLFQPFFTTKPTGEGTGLGLSISYDIITQQHGGTITVESEPGDHTTFTIRLPRRAEAGGAA